jgi:hypothetical protein
VVVEVEVVVSRVRARAAARSDRREALDNAAQGLPRSCERPAASLVGAPVRFSGQRRAAAVIAEGARARAERLDQLGVVCVCGDVEGGCMQWMFVVVLVLVVVFTVVCCAAVVVLVAVDAAAVTAAVVAAAVARSCKTSMVQRCSALQQLGRPPHSGVQPGSAGQAGPLVVGRWFFAEKARCS